MEQALSRSFDYWGQYKQVETLIVCMFNSTSSLFPIASFLYHKGDYNVILPNTEVQN